MKAKRVGALLILASLGIGVSEAANWEQFSTSKSGAKGYTDYDRIKRDGYGRNTYTAWWRADLAKPVSVKGTTFVSHLSLYRIDCDKSSLTTLAAHYYNAKGAVVFSEEVESSPSVVIPDSSGEVFVNAICSAAKIRGL